MHARTPPRGTRVSVAALAVMAVAAGQWTVVSHAAATTPPATRPNIVVINTDDQRFDSLYACLATPPAGRAPPTGSQCPMPGVRDDLAAHGVTFAQSFVTTALCCPSRASLLTGRYAHHTGVLTNAKPDGGFSAFRNLQGSTLATWLHGAGYRTSLVGKYLNQYDACSGVPSCNVPPGWDDWHAEITDGDVDYTNFTLADSTGPGQAAATTYPSPAYSTTVLGDKAVTFVQDALTNHPGQPLFLYFAPFAPHPAAVPAAGDDHAFDVMPGWRPPSWNRDPENGPTWSTDTANNPFHDPTTATGAKYVANKDAEHRNEMDALLEVDRQVHDIVEALGCDTACDTLFVLTSDNGISWGEHRYFDRKNCEFEECHRVPMVVRYDPLTDPGGTGPGRVDASHPVLNVDVAPTAAEAARLTDGAATDGRSFLPLLDSASGNDPPDWRTAVLGEDYGGLVRTGVDTPTLQLIRTFPGDAAGAWKYVELCALSATTVPCPTAERELYDEAGDRYETTNLASAAPAPGGVQATMAHRLTQIASTQPPAVTFSGGPDPATNETSATLSFGSAGASRTWCSLDGAPRSPCVSPVVVPGPLGEGSHTFAVVADGDDPAGGVSGTSDPAVRAWTVDTTPPGTSITAGPQGPMAATVASFSFSSNEAGSTFACRLDGGTFDPCTSPASYTGLSETSHTFRVHAVDAAGNTDPSPASRTWTVDVTPPDTTITGGPDGPTSQPGPFTFTFASSEAGSSFQCRLSGGGYAPCASPDQVGVPGDGNYSLTVKAADPAGNVDPTPDVRSWTVDTVPPPPPSLTQTPSDPSGPDVSFAWTDGDPSASFACSLDGATATPCSPPQPYSSLDGGDHTFAVGAVDPAGNASATAEFSWVVSTTGPDTTFTAGPADGSFTSSTGATFRFTANMGGATFECSLDGAGFSPCSSPASVAFLPDDTHSFSARATAGGLTGSPAQRTWTVDTTAPDTTITGGPSGPFASTGPFSFTFSSNEPQATFKCKLDGSTFAPCTSPFVVGGPLSGSHTVQVKAVDRAGNQDPAAAARSWTVDITPPPPPSITARPPEDSPSSSASFSFTDGDDDAAFTCSLDGAPGSGCDSPEGYAGLADGRHTFDVTAQDAAGNDSAPATYGWTVDTTAPETTITAGPSGSTTATAASFTFTSDEPGAGFGCSLDGSADEPCGSPADYAGLALGDHSFSVQATDGAGNADPTPAVRSWTVTPSVPDTSIDSGPAGPTASSSATFGFASTVEGSTFECQLDGAAFGPCTSEGPGATFSVLADGGHTFVVRAVAAGNADPTPASRTWVVDTHAPDSEVTAPTPDRLLTGTSLTVKWTYADPAPSSGPGAFVLQQRVGQSGDFAPVFSGPARQKALADLSPGATYCWQVTAADPAGNAATSAVACAGVPLDDRAPEVAYAGPTTQPADPGAFQGTLTRLAGVGAQATVTLGARKAGVLFQRGPASGKADVYVDGTLVRTVDLYAASVQQRRYVWWTRFVGVGTHTVRVVWTGKRNPLSAGTGVPIDGVAGIG